MKMYIFVIVRVDVIDNLSKFMYELSCLTETFSDLLLHSLLPRQERDRERDRLTLTTCL